MNDKKIELTLGLVNGILGYLGTRPYGEVFQIVQEIQAQAAPQVPTPDPATEPVSNCQYPLGDMPSWAVSSRCAS